MTELTIHHHPDPFPDRTAPDPHQDPFSKTFLGFWLYIITDCLLFATLFITYAVLHPNTFGGPSGNELFNLPHVFAETMLLLFSSVSCGFVLLSFLNGNKKRTLYWLGATFLLGASFITSELLEFRELIESGNDYAKSAFLSAFFTLVGTHGTHVAFGLLWILFMMIQLSLEGLTSTTFRRLVLFALFWHFLDLIWIFIFSFVYLMGVIA